MPNTYDIAIVGGGFYGCCLALYLRSNNYSVILFEKESDLMLRASAINQARVHTGFHYPRSLTTAIRSLLNFPRFVYEFRKAITDDFTMCYAIARHGSKINAQRFWRMFTDLHAPIKKAPASIKELFSPKMIEDVFCVKEYAFDHNIIRQILLNRLELAKVKFCLDTEIHSCQRKDNATSILTDKFKHKIEAKYVFNCTYSRINNFLENSGLKILALKHELTEMALVRPSSNLNGLAVTVMDGAFFSLMPYPSRNMYTLSHVRYTPHAYWQDTNPCLDGHKILQDYHKKTNFPYMENDLKRFMPKITLQYEESIFEVKTVLQKNENDDGRPIFYYEHPELGHVHTVMGSKIDNIYDLFDSLGEIAAPLKQHNTIWEKFLGIGE